MLKSAFCVSLALGAATLVGCKDDENKTAPPAAPTVPTTMPAVPEVPTPPAATQPAVEVPPVTTPAIPPAPVVTPPPAPAVTAPPTTEPAVPTAAAVDPEAKTLMDQVEDAIKNKKWDDAEAALKKLEAMKDKLPPDWQDKLKNLKSAIDAGKLSSKIPGF